MSKKIQIFGKDHSGTFREIKVDEEGHLTSSYYFRDVTSSGSSTLTRATETTILAGNGHFHDLVFVSCANTSTVAQRIDLRAGTGGAIYDTIAVPAQNTVARNYSIPLMASEKGQAWTAQNNSGGEISDSPITVTMVAMDNGDY